MKLLVRRVLRRKRVQYLFLLELSVVVDVYDSEGLLVSRILVRLVVADSLIKLLGELVELGVEGLAYICSRQASEALARLGKVGGRCDLDRLRAVFLLKFDKFRSVVFEEKLHTDAHAWTHQHPI